MTTANKSLTNHLDCISDAAKQMLSATCGINPVNLDTNENLATDGMILAIISLMGDVEWSVFLGLPSKTATGMAAKFAGFEIPFDSPDMGDAIGELTNIFAGEVKRTLDKRGIKAEISLPSVMRAQSLEVLIQRNSMSSKFCFDSELGKYWAGVLEKGNGFVL